MKGTTTGLGSRPMARVRGSPFLYPPPAPLPCPREGMPNRTLTPLPPLLWWWPEIFLEGGVAERFLGLCLRFPTNRLGRAFRGGLKTLDSAVLGERG